MQDKLASIILTIRDALPKPGDAREAASKVGNSSCLAFPHADQFAITNLPSRPNPPATA